MLKIQFKRKKPVLKQDPYQPPVYENQYTERPFGQEFGQDNVSPFGDGDEFPSKPSVPIQQENDTCLFCGSEITSSHLSVTTKSGEHRIHPSCIVSGFALLANSIGLLFSWLKAKKGGK